jgi:hypothetical protein
MRASDPNNASDDYSQGASLPKHKLEIIEGRRASRDANGKYCLVPDYTVKGKNATGGSGYTVAEAMRSYKQQLARFYYGRKVGLILEYKCDNCGEKLKWLSSFCKLIWKKKTNRSGEIYICTNCRSYFHNKKGAALHKDDITICRICNR